MACSKPVRCAATSVARGLDLGFEEARIRAGEEVDQVELVGDRVVDALHPLRDLALVLPDVELEADFLGDLGHRVVDRLEERNGARGRDADDRLARHAGLGVEGLSGRFEHRQLLVGFERGSRLRGDVALGMRGRSRESPDRRQGGVHDHPFHHWFPFPLPGARPSPRHWTGAGRNVITLYT
jgi:hypothetical protein